MRKLYLLIICVLISTNLVIASEAQRKISSGDLSSSTLVLAESGRIYDIEIIATAAGGYATVFDSENNNTSGKTKLIELREATQNNSKHANLGEDGLRANRGIYVFLNDATAIIHYR